MIATRSARTFGIGVALGLLALIPACGKEGASDHTGTTDTAAVTHVDTASAAQATTGAADTSSPASIPNDRLPVIVVDEAHQTVETPGNPSIPHYKMKASEGFTLDASQYHFKRPVNSVQVLFEAGGGYITDWGKDSAHVVVRPGMLRPLQPYNGDRSFSKGHNYQIVVGYAGKTDERGYPSSFDAVWMANVDIE